MICATVGNMSAVENKLRVSQDAGGIGPMRDNVVISPKGVGGNLVFLPLFPENNSVAKSAGGEGVPIPILYPSSDEVAEMRGRRPYTVGRLPGSAVESGSIGLWLADPRVVGTASLRCRTRPVCRGRAGSPRGERKNEMAVRWQN